MALIKKNYCIGQPECHDDVRNRSLKQKCFEMSPEWIQWRSRCNFARQIVPHIRCSNRESSVADRWQSDMRHHQAIGVGGAESSTIDVQHSSWDKKNFLQRYTQSRNSLIQITRARVTLTLILTDVVVFLRPIALIQMNRSIVYTNRGTPAVV